MPFSAEISLEWDGGEHTFKLAALQIEELQRLCGVDNEKGVRVPVGFGLIWQRAHIGGWGHADIAETIRLGLIGGGMSHGDAKRIARDYAGPPYRAGQKGGPERTALAILDAAMHGLETLPPGEKGTPEAT